MGNEQKGKSAPAPKNPTTNEIKTYIMIIQNKLNLFRNKKIASIKQKKKEIGKYLKENNLDVAKAKMDTIIREEDMITVYDILGPLCEILKERVTYIISNTECPPDLRAQLDSVLYAATRMEIEELHTLRDMIMRIYGQAYIMKAESNADKLVNVNLVEKLRIKPASDVFVTIRLKQLCKEQKIPFEFPMEVENDIAIDSINPQNPYGGPNMNPFDMQANNNLYGPPQNINNNINSNPYGPHLGDNNPYDSPSNNNNPYGPPQNMNNNMNNNPYSPPSNNANLYGTTSGNINPFQGPNNNHLSDNSQMNFDNSFGSSQEGNPFDSKQGVKPYGHPQNDNTFSDNLSQRGNPYENHFNQNIKPFEQNLNNQFAETSQGNNDNNLDCKYSSLRNKPSIIEENSKESKFGNIIQSKENDNKMLKESPSSGQANNNDNPYLSQINENNKKNNPFGDESNDNPFAGTSSNKDNQLARDSNKNDNPFGGETNENPYGGDSNKNDNPFDGETNENPYGGDSNKNDNPFGGETDKNPYGGDSNKNDNPFLQDNNNPFGNSMADSIVNPYAGDSNENSNKNDELPKSD